MLGMKKKTRLLSKIPKYTISVADQDIYSFKKLKYSWFIILH